MRNVYLRELDLVDPLDAALAGAFAPHRVGETITAMVGSQDQPDTDEASALARSQLAECDQKLVLQQCFVVLAASSLVVAVFGAGLRASSQS